MRLIFEQLDRLAATSPNHGAKVAACVLDGRGKIIGTGVNTVIGNYIVPSIFHETAFEGKLPHAEDNAFEAAAKTKNETMTALLRLKGRHQKKSAKELEERFGSLALCITHPPCFRCAGMILTKLAHRTQPVRNVIISNQHLNLLSPCDEHAFGFPGQAQLIDEFAIKHFYSILAALALLAPDAFLGDFERLCGRPISMQKKGELPPINLLVFDPKTQKLARLDPFIEFNLLKDVNALKRRELIEGFEDILLAQDVDTEFRIRSLEKLFHRIKILPEATFSTHKGQPRQELGS